MALKNSNSILIDLRAEDAAPAGRFGVVQLDYVWTSAFVDPQSDTLYVTPYSSAFPMSFGEPSNIGAASNIIYSIATDGVHQRAALWERDEIVLRDPKSMRIAQSNFYNLNGQNYTVTITSFDNNNNQTQTANLTITNQFPFTLPPYIGRKYNISFSFQFTNLNASTVTEIETFVMAESESSLYAPEQ